MSFLKGPLNANWLDEAWKCVASLPEQHHEVVCDSFLLVYPSIISFLPWMERAARWRRWLPERLCRNRLLSSVVIQFWVDTQSAPYTRRAEADGLRLRASIRDSFDSFLKEKTDLAQKYKICPIAKRCSSGRVNGCFETQKNSGPHIHHNTGHIKCFDWCKSRLNTNYRNVKFVFISEK